MYVIRQAIDPDRAKIRKLLIEVGITYHDTDDFYRHSFVVEEVNEQNATSLVVGTVGIEVYETYGLLKTFILERANWNAKLGVQMIQVMLSHVKELKLTHVYLLTKSAVSFFEQLGFSIISLLHVPDEIKESKHVQKMKDKGFPMVYTCYPTHVH